MEKKMERRGGVREGFKKGWMERKTEERRRGDERREIRIEK